MGNDLSNQIDLSWESVQKLPASTGLASEQLDVLKTFQPGVFEYIVGRSNVVELSPNKWAEINDPVYNSLLVRKKGVKRYFACCIYLLATDPRAIESIPKGCSKTLKKCLSVTTSNKNTLTGSLSVKATLGMKHSTSMDIPEGPKASSEYSATVEASLGIVKSTEDSRTETVSQEQTMAFNAATDDMQVVPWMMIKGLAVYREVIKNGAIELVAYSEYPQLPAMYRSYGSNFKSC